MPGHFGTADTEDGLYASTKSSGNVGVFGNNESLDAPTGGGAGGAGVFGLTLSPGAAGVFGANNGAQGAGVQGNGPEAGVSGWSDHGAGLRAHSNHGDACDAFAHDPAGNGVLAMNDATTAPAPGGAPKGNGILAVTTVPGAAGAFGANNHATLGVGVQGNGPEAGVSGFSETGAGLRAHSNHGDACDAFAHDPAGNGVLAMNDATSAPAPGGAPKGNGILAVTTVPGAAGAFGANNHATLGVGVQGNGPESGVSGWSENGVGVLAQSNHIGLTAKAPIAGHFEGDVEVTGDIKLLGADCAEDFDVADPAAAEPGTVMVLDDTGGVRVSDRDYDSRVAGVMSGAGTYRPAVILDRRGSTSGRLPLAIMGKVYCKVDATRAPVAVGDLLTTSSTPGHAMKAEDPGRAFGAVIGKAMQACSGTRGLIPILVALQ